MLNVEIRVAGEIDPDWEDWFKDFTLSRCAENETIICGKASDQSAFFGLITKLRDLGLTLISIKTELEKN